jgi:hypothetical protein
MTDESPGQHRVVEFVPGGRRERENLDSHTHRTRMWIALGDIGSEKSDDRSTTSTPRIADDDENPRKTGGVSKGRFHPDARDACLINFSTAAKF